MYMKKPKGKKKNSVKAQKAVTMLYLEPNQSAKSNIDKEHSPVDHKNWWKVHRP